MSEVKRYDLRLGDEPLLEFNKGEYVLYSDYQKLQEEFNTQTHNLNVFNREYVELKSKLDKAVEALKFECGGRCAHQNQCNARETLAEIGEK